MPWPAQAPIGHGKSIRYHPYTCKADGATRQRPLLRSKAACLVPDRSKPIEAENVDRAAEILIERRDTHLDSFIERLREPRVQHVISPILEGELVLGDRLDDDDAYVKDLGSTTEPSSSSTGVRRPGRSQSAARRRRSSTTAAGSAFSGSEAARPPR